MGYDWKRSLADIRVNDKLPMMTLIWWTALVALVALSAALIWRRGITRVVVAVLASFIFLQTSAQFHLVPWYKGGGDGAGLGG